MPLNFVAKPNDFDMYKGSKEIMRTRSSWLYRLRYLWFPFCALGPPAVFYIWPNSLPMWMIRISPILAMMSLMLFMWVLLQKRIQLNQSIQNAKTFVTPTAYTLNEKGFTQESAVELHRVRWDAFIDAQNTSQGIALLIAEAHFVTIPKTAFASKEAQLETLQTIQGWIKAAKASA
ncbi:MULTISPECIES: YcxB family protein [Pacificibacter]|uniref:YcxB family protein n=1 Tax=Pacificibacter TaxID=1042323 RepID=UPI001C096804|nr:MULTISPECIES: YcxB family protein [Pacificibacter]MBU2935398.1 YcxB family protein [Pacificibacter marinus]MDO6615553.1 YcxB family protein [Pacificibacter sp. 1_MG-2023]